MYGRGCRGHQCEAWSLRDRGQTAGQVGNSDQEGESWGTDSSGCGSIDSGEIRGEEDPERRCGRSRNGNPAPVDSEGVVQQTANVGWGYKEVTRELSELLDGMRVEAGNDANVAAMGEMWLGAGRGEKNVVMVTLGTGVGGGVIVNGHMIVGQHGAGGEIGHICVNREEEDACGCGLHGCLEQYASQLELQSWQERP